MIDLYPKQIEAYKVVAAAKARGDLVVGTCDRADETCRGRIEGHHEDYDKPLDVVWLCGKHHRELHRGAFA